jgi:hypothetical protein
MRHSTILWLFIFHIICFHQACGQGAGAELPDSTLSLFWNPDLKINIKILDPLEENPGKNNAVLTLYNESRGQRIILYRDSMFAYILEFKLKDINGDGINDLLVYNMDNGAQNKSYHLYLVDQKKGQLMRVKKFERVYSPELDPKRCIIHGFESYEKKIILRYYVIDRRGGLSFTE